MKIDRYISAGNFPYFPLFPADRTERGEPPTNMPNNSRFWGLKAETDERWRGPDGLPANTPSVSNQSPRRNIRRMHSLHGDIPMIKSDLRRAKPLQHLCHEAPAIICTLLTTYRVSSRRRMFSPTTPRNSAAIAARLVDLCLKG